jgi:hypothetical protein
MFPKEIIYNPWYNQQGRELVVERCDREATLQILQTTKWIQHLPPGALSNEQKALRSAINLDSHILKKNWIYQERIFFFLIPRLFLH